MNFKITIALAIICVVFACAEEKKKSKKGSTDSATKENKDVTKSTYDEIAGDWVAFEIAETPEDQLELIPGSADIFLIINKDRTFCTMYNLDTITSGNYTVKEGQVVFNETKNHLGGKVRYLSAKVIFDKEKMELIGEWVEHDGMKEYHHSSFIRGKYDPEKIQEKMDLSSKKK